MLLARKGQVDEARNHLQSIRSRSGQQALVIVQAEGDLLIQAGRYEEAIGVYTEALDDGYNPDLLYARAMAAEKTGRLDLLEQDLRSILEREPDHARRSTRWDTPWPTPPTGMRRHTS